MTRSEFEQAVLRSFDMIILTSTGIGKLSNDMEIKKELYVQGRIIKD